MTKDDGDGNGDINNPADTDGDCLTNDLETDDDGDGVNDSDDFLIGTNPLDTDSDDDGVGDNKDNLNNLLSKVYSYDEMLPRLPSDIYFNNVVGMGAGCFRRGHKKGGMSSGAALRSLYSSVCALLSDSLLTLQNAL